jgi:lipoyl-dependent peroxiredoxin subunit D
MPSNRTWVLIPFRVTPATAFPQAGQNLWSSLSSVPQLSQNIRLSSSRPLNLLQEPTTVLYEVHGDLFGNNSAVQITGALEQLQSRLPQYASDLKSNLASVLSQTELAPRQIFIIALASAYASGNAPLVESLREEAARHVSSEDLEAAKGAAALMAMTNVYFRFSHSVGDGGYEAIPSRLRMNITRTHGIDRVDFDLCCLAVSAINGCQACMAAHEGALRKRAVTKDAIAAAVRIAAVVRGVATVLDIEKVS